MTTTELCKSVYVTDFGVYSIPDELFIKLFPRLDRRTREGKLQGQLERQVAKLYETAGWIEYLYDVKVVK